MIASQTFARRLAVLLLPALIAVLPPAAAQNKSSTERATPDSRAPNAPVGHRQPTAADVAKAKPTPFDLEQEKRERELNKKLQICRGC
jgi:hypothetical protein